MFPLDIHMEDKVKYKKYENTEESLLLPRPLSLSFVA
jgi:hypothetical protein